MTFSYVITKVGVFGDLRYAIGTFNSASATSGSINTGLKTILFSTIRNKVTAGAGLVDDTTTAGIMAISAVTSNDTGEFIAFGY